MDVGWDDGIATTARDVVWTLEAARDPATGYPRFTDLESVTSVAALDDSTVELRFTGAPMSRSGDDLPDVLTDLAILPGHLLGGVPHARLGNAWWNVHRVGTGPCRYVGHEPTRRWVFERSLDFPPDMGGPPHVDRLIVVIVDEPMVKLSALVAGELDFAGISPQHAAFVERHHELAIREYPLIFPYGLVFNTRRPPFDDLRARRAAALAIDRQEIVDGYLFGFAAVADGPVPPGLPAYRAPPHLPVAPDSARRLVAELDGTAPPGFELLTVGSGEGALEQMLQARLAAVGFCVTIRQLELATFLNRVYGERHDFTAAVIGIPGDPGIRFLQALVGLTRGSVSSDPTAGERR